MPRPPRHLALGYIRVSSYLGRDRGDALTEDLQLEKIQQWCAVADLELVDVLRDVDKSGKDVDGRGRPAFAELLRRLEAGEASALVVYRMSRFGRGFLRDDPHGQAAARPGHPVPQRVRAHRPR